MTQDDHLVEIPVENWPELRDMFNVEWPKHIVDYYTIDNYIKWKEKSSEIPNLKVYSLNDEWKRDGCAIIVDRYQLLMCSLDDTSSQLKRALELVDWRGGLKVSSFVSMHRPAVLHLVESRKYEKEYDSETVLYYLPRHLAEAVLVECSSDIDLRPMSRDDAIVADRVWPNKHIGSLFFLQRLIAWNPNVGAYTKDGRLVAWCFRLQSGALGALQVDEQFKRRGLGTLVAKAMIRKLTDLRMDTFAFVNVDNAPSRRMFENLGFIQIDYVYWLRTLPTDSTIPSWTD
ncbi:glycine-N-acyltransferase-like protein 3 isoform X1 [Sergentomyia squamirostris]